MLMYVSIVTSQVNEFISKDIKKRSKYISIVIVTSIKPAAIFYYLII